MPIHVEDRFLPLFVITRVGVCSDQEFADYLARMSRTIHGPVATRRVLVFDDTEGGPASPSQRKMQAEWLKVNEQRLREITIRMIFVAPSALQRGLLTAVFWLAPLPVGHKVVPSLKSALDAAAEALEAESLAPPQGAKEALLEASPHLQH